MSLDPKIKQAIEEAAKVEGQSQAFTRKLTAWVDALTNGNERIDDNESVRRHLGLLYEEAKTK